MFPSSGQASSAGTGLLGPMAVILKVDPGANTTLSSPGSTPILHCLLLIPPPSCPISAFLLLPCGLTCSSSKWRVCWWAAATTCHLQQWPAQLLLIACVCDHACALCHLNGNVKEPEDWLLMTCMFCAGESQSYKGPYWASLSRHQV